MKFFDHPNKEDYLISSESKEETKSSKKKNEIQDLKEDHDAIKKDFNSVLKIRLLVEEIYGEFLKFDLRNGELRKKSDAIKWNLNKLEDLVLSLNLTSRV